MKKVLNIERSRQMYIDLMDELMTECPEDCIPFLIPCLTLIQERYTYISKKYPDIEASGMDLILRFSWVPFEELLEDEQYREPDVPTFMHFLFVNRIEYYNLSKRTFVFLQHDSKCNSLSIPSLTSLPLDPFKNGCPFPNEPASMQ